ncbi:MAG: hypothetical protein R2788_03850 [Saprospiraceae bacterium]
MMWWILSSRSRKALAFNGVMPLPIKYQDRSLSQELNLLCKGYYGFLENRLNHIQDLLEGGNSICRIRS